MPTLRGKRSIRRLKSREEAGIPFGTPLNVYDLCELLQPRVRVRFADYSMEGCYCRSDRPLIEVSALRPLGRRVFNTAHELGHHELGHPGMRLDEHLEEGADENSDPDEFAANAFAGFLLMPKIGVRQAFSVRGWSIANPKPEQAFVVACHFGVGYETLVNHLAYGLREIRHAQAEQMTKVHLPQIRRRCLGRRIQTDYGSPIATTGCRHSTRKSAPRCYCRSAAGPNSTTSFTQAIWPRDVCFTQFDRG